MTKSLRLTEKWMHRGLWLVALVFASFLIGLGSAVVGDLPQVEQTLTVDDFSDKTISGTLKSDIKSSELAEQTAEAALKQARLKRAAARADTESASETFENWLSTRRATARGDQDTELIARTKALDDLKAKERATGVAMEVQQKAALDASQTGESARKKLEVLNAGAQLQLDAANRKVELRVFLYRLALTLPLLAIAGWLFVKKRKGTYWPFVWGFVIFALFAFFVELVPYLPSYGGYVRYIVGIVVTVLIGRQAIVSLNRYLERQKLAEQMPNIQRRDELSYDTALTRLSKNVCPGCERPVDLKNTEVDFCPHCGIGLFDHCGVCNTRKSAFAKFCQACGASGQKMQGNTGMAGAVGGVSTTAAHGTPSAGATVPLTTAPT